MKKTLAIASASLVALTLAAAPPAEAKVPYFKNCTAMNKVYKHGVGKKGAHDKTSGIPVTNFTRNNKLYWYYSSSKGVRIRDLDKDNDGIACEKR